jgi:hypothetical protein
MNVSAISNYQLTNIQYDYSVKMTAKQQDHAEVQGAQVMKLINSASVINENKVDVYA